MQSIALVALAGLAAAVPQQYGAPIYTTPSVPVYGTTTEPSAVVQTSVPYTTSTTYSLLPTEGGGYVPSSYYVQTSVPSTTSTTYSLLPTEGGGYVPSSYYVQTSTPGWEGWSSTTSPAPVYTTPSTEGWNSWEQPPTTYSVGPSWSEYTTQAPPPPASQTTWAVWTTVVPPPPPTSAIPTTSVPTYAPTPVYTTPAIATYPGAASNVKAPVMGAGVALVMAILAL